MCDCREKSVNGKEAFSSRCCWRHRWLVRTYQTRSVEKTSYWQINLFSDSQRLSNLKLNIVNIRLDSVDEQFPAVACHYYDQLASVRSLRCMFCSVVSFNTSDTIYNKMATYHQTISEWLAGGGGGVFAVFAFQNSDSLLPQWLTCACQTAR